MDVDKELRDMFPGSSEWGEYFLLRVRKDDVTWAAYYLLGVLIGYILGRRL